jgi:hypothetical protein
LSTKNGSLLERAVCLVIRIIVGAAFRFALLLTNGLSCLLVILRHGLSLLRSNEVALQELLLCSRFSPPRSSCLHRRKPCRNISNRLDFISNFSPAPAATIRKWHKENALKLINLIRGFPTTRFQPKPVQGLACGHSVLGRMQYAWLSDSTRSATVSIGAPIRSNLIVFSLLFQVPAYRVRFRGGTVPCKDTNRAEGQALGGHVQHAG